MAASFVIPPLIAQGDPELTAQADPSAMASADDKSQLCEETRKLSLAAQDNEESDSAFKGIPDEVVLIILSYLEAEDLCRVACVCRALNALAKDEGLWRRLFQRFIKVEGR